MGWYNDVDWKCDACEQAFSTERGDFPGEEDYLSHSTYCGECRDFLDDMHDDLDNEEEFWEADVPHTEWR